jgi:hypothetical protein
MGRNYSPLSSRLAHSIGVLHLLTSDSHSLVYVITLTRTATKWLHHGPLISSLKPQGFSNLWFFGLANSEHCGHQSTQVLLYGALMARYVTTIPSSLTPQAAFAYMADLHNFAKWDKGVVKVVQVEGSGAGLGTIFDVTVKGLGKSTSTLRYTTTEYDEYSNILVRGVNTLFTSVDRVTINKTDTGCEVIYDATLTANWIIAGVNLVLGKVFNKIGDTATRGLREALA